MLNKIKKLIPLQAFKFLQPVYHFLMAYVAALYYNFPSRKLLIIGVTGTTGKTTTVYLLSRLLSENGYKAGYTSTAQFNNGEKEWLNDKKMTMPGRFFLQKNLRKMIKNDCRVAIVETTSQGIEQFRHRFINYDLLVFTNLYPEHIEAHGGFENYKKAKGKLFSHLARCKSKYFDSDNKVVIGASGLKQTELRKIKKTIIVNGDDEQASYFLSFAAERKCVYTSNEKLRVENLNLNNQEEIKPVPEIFLYQSLFSGAEGSDFQFLNNHYHLPVLGSYNVYNAVAALSIAEALGIESKKTLESLSKIKTVAGKMEKIEAGQNFTVLVDYAFEPKALAALYENLKHFNYQHLIHILGSTGGGRDQSRRQILGNLAGKEADIVIVTNEDPYDEDPQIIIDQVAAGAENADKEPDKSLFKVLDRREAFRLAFKLAQADDLVLITGKGAEQYICAKNGHKIPWDDRKVAREELANL
ncbi:UDP-N-acetylmuramyl-tripeptide synthetase [Patescibacteria group bacterium]|nr:UDP-N-acetylmuramyl-tripeptide synthetase [Patescibacteria group bacterium]